MHLGPHHFQAQGRYFEDLINFTIAGLGFELYGLIGCQFDELAIRNGTISLLHARGVFPDGLPFDMPGSDAPPPTRNIDDLFPPARTSLDVLLAIAPRRREGLNCVLSEQERSNNVRYTAKVRSIVDESTGKDERQVRIGRKNISVLLETEETGDAITLPVSRVMRDGSGHFVFDPDFIPPCLQLVASARLMTIARQLIDLLDEKSKALSKNRISSSPLSY